jgi:hypothetical protein
MTAAVPTSTESRALTLLGQGIGPEMVASALGVSVSLISQLLSREDFATKVTELRYAALVHNNDRDANYDALEDKLLKKMEDCLPMMFDPLKILRAIQVINGAKRRGSTAPDSMIQKQTIVQLNLPVQIINQFANPQLTLNSNNQVVNAGGQDLITVQSSKLPELVEQARAVKNVKELSHVQTQSSA